MEMTRSMRECPAGRTKGRRKSNHTNLFKSNKIFSNLKKSNAYGNDKEYEGVPYGQKSHKSIQILQIYSNLTN